ncbi:MAG: acyl transferase [Cyclobacteriaceae bacterium]|nr:acyl transferase [Cyclobacteriaceae bacterium]
MIFLESLQTSLFSVNINNFEERCISVFRHQAQNNIVYKEYLSHLGIHFGQVNHFEEIPFLPIGFFKSRIIKNGDWTEQKIFESSGTTFQTRSRHYVKDLNWYCKVSRYIFESFYGPLKEWTILALLPSYLERNNASLAYMTDYFIKQTKNENSGFYLYNYVDLLRVLKKLRKKNSSVLLLGVTFALLDFAEKFDGEDMSHVIFMETGGMKGKKEEITREQVHSLLKRQLNIKEVHSEYGMTELMSQAYARDGERFYGPSWFKICLRDVNDPFSKPVGQNYGGINIIDLANIHTCSFIETEDIGTFYTDGSFKVLGRLDHSDVRGCNLMVW